MDLTRRELLKATAAAAAVGTGALAGVAPAAPAPAVAKAGAGVPSTGAGGAVAEPLRLWYRRPATQWVEALPLGNGRLGAMVWGGGRYERLQLNEDTLYAGGPYDPTPPGALAALPEVRRLLFAGRYAEAEALANATMMGRPKKQMPYQPLGDLQLDFLEVSDVNGYRRELDLDRALASSTFGSGWKLQHRREAFVSAVDQCLAVRLSALVSDQACSLSPFDSTTQVSPTLVHSSDAALAIRILYEVFRSLRSPGLLASGIQAVMTIV